jgi:hypothetical protein
MEMQYPAQSSNINCNNRITIGDGPAHLGTYIGDFPEYQPAYPFGPVQQPTIVPIPQKMYPLTVPYLPPYNPADITTDDFGWRTIGSTLVTPSPWRVTFLGGKVIASTDVPGVKLDDITVELENGTIKVTGKRFDTGAHVNLTQFIGNDYDPATAEAALGDGVLAIEVRKFKDKVSHKVSVKAK